MLHWKFATTAFWNVDTKSRTVLQRDRTIMTFFPKSKITVGFITALDRIQVITLHMMRKLCSTRLTYNKLLRKQSTNTVLSNLFDPVGRIRHTVIMKPRAAPVNSKGTTKICWTLVYCICVIVIFWNQRYAHATFDKCYPFSVTNCHKSQTPSL